MNKIISFIWEPIKEPVLLIAAVALGVVFVVLASYFMFAGMLICIHFEWFDWRFFIGVGWAVVSLWMICKLIHRS